MNQTMILSPAATVVLTRAAERLDQRLEFARKLPAGGRQRMIGSLLRAGFVEEAKAPPGSASASATDRILVNVVLTDAGFVAIGRERRTAAIAEEAAVKLIYLGLRRVERDWKMSPREWIAAKNQFAILFADRFVNA